LFDGKTTEPDITGVTHKEETVLELGYNQEAEAPAIWPNWPRLQDARGSASKDTDAGMVESSRQQDIKGAALMTEERDNWRRFVASP